mgnify:CR=1 FL=1
MGQAESEPNGVIEIKWSEIGITFGIVLYGSIAHTLMVIQSKKKSSKITFLKKVKLAVPLMLTNMAVAGFTSIMVYTLCKEFGFSTQMLYFAGGMSGFAGGKILEQLEVKFISKMIGAYSADDD